MYLFILIKRHLNLKTLHQCHFKIQLMMASSHKFIPVKRVHGLLRGFNSSKVQEEMYLG